MSEPPHPTPRELALLNRVWLVLFSIYALSTCLVSGAMESTYGSPVVEPTQELGLFVVLTVWLGASGILWLLSLPMCLANLRDAQRHYAHDFLPRWLAGAGFLTCGASAFAYYMLWSPP